MLWSYIRKTALLLLISLSDNIYHSTFAGVSMPEMGFIATGDDGIIGRMNPDEIDSDSFKKNQNF